MEQVFTIRYWARREYSYRASQNGNNAPFKLGSNWVLERSEAALPLIYYHSVFAEFATCRKFHLVVWDVTCLWFFFSSTILNAISSSVICWNLSTESLPDSQNECTMKRDRGTSGQFKGNRGCVTGHSVTLDLFEKKY